MGTGGYVAADGDRLALLARHCGEAADELEHNRRRVATELRALGLDWSGTFELARIEAWLRDEQRGLRRRASEAQDADKPKGHHHKGLAILGHAASSFGHGVWEGTAGIVKGAVGLGEMSLHSVEEPAHLVEAFWDEGASGAVREAKAELERDERMVKGLAAEGRHLAEMSQRFSPAGPLYLAWDIHEHGLDKALSRWAYDAGTLVPDAALAAATWGGGETAVVDAEGAEANVRAAARAAARAKAAEATTPPLAFSDMDKFTSFGSTMRAGLEAAGYHDVDIAISGSSVTGMSWLTGEPFDVGRVSDLDLALGGEDLFESAKEAGVKTWNRDARTPPLKPKQVAALGLEQVAQELSQRLGRDVSLMLYRSIDDALARRLTVMVPKG